MSRKTNTATRVRDLCGCGTEQLVRELAVGGSMGEPQCGLFFLSRMLTLPVHRCLVICPQSTLALAVQLFHLCNGVCVELFKLPLNVNSMRARKHQEALHKQLDDVENSIKIFERPVVYIQA